MNKKDKVKELFDANRLDDALTELGAMEGDEAWVAFMAGRIAWRRGDKAGAISSYERAVAINPASEAAVALEQARSIMNFYNKDLLNP